MNSKENDQYYDELWDGWRLLEAEKEIMSLDQKKIAKLRDDDLEDIISSCELIVDKEGDEDVIATANSVLAILGVWWNPTLKIWQYK